MSEENRQEAEKLAKRLNGYFHALFGAWLGVTAVFWLQAWGPMREHGGEPLALPVFPLFAVSVAAGFAVNLLPRSWYAVRDPCRAILCYQRLGILRLRRWITDGDYVRQRARQLDPAYVVDGAKRGLLERLSMTREIERAHLAFLLFGLATAVCAATAGWWIWAAAITISNVAVNLLPALMQRYTRSRVMRICSIRNSTAIP
ncbi:hypothetical protein [Qipengyuania sphaerica]|uniref:glycosyl-4,4'-diaponeurosporenoate acyltransferase CrtO family protein n=1 Tax=Qipengyuania sphaerica TaxID=2867243 RepID=UPI001C876446|nr:hypothetical protein [Qipengyuania sphaerica]MBX7540696.1 hypothetical protein [Qipengyuania sphaerica]